jgi:competence protein ComEA
VVKGTSAAIIFAPTIVHGPVFHCETDGRRGRDALARDIMRAMSRAALALLMSAAVLLTATIAAASRSSTQDAPPAAANTQDRFPEAAGKAALLKVCSNCHTAESVVQSLRTRQEWSDVVDQMSRYGAQATDQEFDQILAYLVKYFSPIAINKAAAKDLESALEVPANVAAAIVATRTESGDFKSVDDLKKVPGIDAAKIDALRPRLVF